MRKNSMIKKGQITTDFMVKAAIVIAVIVTFLIFYGLFTDKFSGFLHLFRRRT